MLCNIFKCSKKGTTTNPLRICPRTGRSSSNGARSTWALSATDALPPGEGCSGTCANTTTSRLGGIIRIVGIIGIISGLWSPLWPVVVRLLSSGLCRGSTVSAASDFASQQVVVVAGLVPVVRLWAVPASTHTAAAAITRSRRRRDAVQLARVQIGQLLLQPNDLVDVIERSRPLVGPGAFAALPRR